MDISVAIERHRAVPGVPKDGLAVRIEINYALLRFDDETRKPTLSDGERRRLESTIEVNENRIDDTVFTLYGVVTSAR